MIRGSDLFDFDSHINKIKKARKKAKARPRNKTRNTKTTKKYKYEEDNKMSDEEERQIRFLKSQVRKGKLKANTRVALRKGNSPYENIFYIDENKQVVTYRQKSWRDKSN